ncbi:MAG: DedA family protein [Proteobacteria bacterium]|nr:DedA family protein [Pseudomonadota bacterium]MBS1246761.1 DedA family protein [Pseudomonadota bacterium]
MLADVSLWGLFLSAFVSSTLFPGGSEVVLGVLAAERHYDPWLLLAIASFGNTLGALTTWLLGYLLARRFPLEDHLSKHRQRALAWLRRWGSPALLLSWLPVVGDPLCFAAGFLRLPFLASLVFIALGKAARYAVILLAFV